jgi:hypothetical protein
MAIVATGIESLMICPVISITHKKEGRRQDTAEPTKSRAMQFPLNLRLA